MPIANNKYKLLLFTGSSQEAEPTLELLRANDFQVECVFDFQAAQELDRKKSYHLVICDCSCSRSFFLSQIRTWQNRKSDCHIPVLFIMSLENGDDILNCILHDNVDFVTRPFHAQELIIRIRHLLLLSRAEHTIQRQNRKLHSTLIARDKLYSVIAHDLRAPVGTIKMISSALEIQKEKIDNPEIRQMIDMINETTEDAFNLLENLLQWVRNQNGKVKVFACCFDLSATLRQVVSLFSTIARIKKIRLSYHPTDALYVYADEDMVKTVLRNLLSNALKFTYPGGTVEILVSVTEEGALVSVKDNGKGMSKEVQAKLLKASEHAVSYGTCNEKGCGLGLTLSLDFVKMNRGRLFFTSEEGQGSTFSFTLPLSPVQESSLSDNC